MTVRILNCDVMDGLAQLGDESVHCCVTSPPYWGLRDYGAAGQIGLEPTLQEHIAKLVEVFREVRRVLRKDGTLWLNYGDAYCSTDKWGGGTNGNTGKQTVRDDGEVPSWAVRGRKPAQPGLKPKDLMLMPERLAIALCDDGWYIRSRIIWHKPNPMPESVTDRPTKSHEHIWLMTKSPRYFFDAEAIKERATYDGPNSPESIKSPYGQGFARRAAVSDDRKELRSPVESRHRSSIPGGQSMEAEPSGTRNSRDVWTIATTPYSEAHFATFPAELAERCIMAGASEHGCCTTCCAPWSRVIGEVAVEPDKSQRSTSHYNTAERYGAGNGGNSGFDALAAKMRAGVGKGTIGWKPTCKCEQTFPLTPCTVLDIFGGAGTTGLVADRLQRNAILIELNPDYAEMARKRLTKDAPLFAEVSL